MLDWLGSVLAAYGQNTCPEEARALCQSVWVLADEPRVGPWRV